MNITQLEIKEDGPSDQVFALQNYELVEERLIWQHLTRRKMNKMHDISEQEYRKQKLD
ncbi:hypothetical protein [Polynucleobacter sp. AP-Sving-400A-A2]|uniref:hypothetical protein n=1 Tax=Polynucleobacter sp. AP-Sving-400A-A2 TaxID=2081049 RepID=UPI001BFD84F1|nr:hypothetical protein [Polynucleobacter sp. AP-Sving-400A-A2]QWE13767.1 hypothetical protein C2758_06120 [Polynucleobacter sp. AP-Sving-400A-A2]